VSAAWEREVLVNTPGATAVAFCEQTVFEGISERKKFILPLSTFGKIRFFSLSFKRKQIR
jgi:hypothetical protein